MLQLHKFYMGSKYLGYLVPLSSDLESRLVDAVGNTSSRLQLSASLQTSALPKVSHRTTGVATNLPET